MSVNFSSRVFTYPDFFQHGVFKTANFNHLIQLYEKELLMPVKLGFKLNHRVLFPGPIERQSVQLTSAVFSDSTVEALKYYSQQGHPEFLETADFISVILQWWKLVNAKSTFISTKTRDSHREAITKENLVEKTSFLRGFVDWLSVWEQHSKPERRLSSETFQAAKHSSECLASIFEYLLHDVGLKFVLPIKLQNDKIEGHFGQIRQMCGGNLFASVRQFLESERSLKMMNLAHLNLQVSDIDDIFFDANVDANKNILAAANQIFDSLKIDTDVQLLPEIPTSDKDALVYVSGCFARQVAKSTSCEHCKSIILQTESDSAATKEETDNQDKSYIAQVNRGGLTYPSELTFLICAHAWTFYTKVMKDQILKNILSKNISSCQVFVQSFLKFLNSSQDTRLTFIEQCCEKGHLFNKHVFILATKCFNIFTKNYISLLNSKIHESRKRSSDKKREPCKREPSVFKSLKLQSEKF